MKKQTYALDARETVELGGVAQSIRLRSTDPALPVLLFLHGGPGVCDRHWVLGDQSALAQVATMVCWDQRGAGLSYRRGMAESELSVDRLVEDAAELTALLAQRFGREKILVVGHSWGTLLGTLLAARHPEHIGAYIGMGQFVDGTRNEALSYEFVLDEARKRGDARALRALARIGAPVKGHYRSLDDLMVQRNLMTKYGGGTWKGRESLMTSMVLPLLRTSEYRLRDLKNYSDGAFFSLRAIWESVVDYDLRTEVPALDMPVYLTEGRHDQNTPPVLAEEWFRQLRAPKKEWIWFEESAHSPIKEEPERWGAEVRRIVLENSPV